MSTQQITLPNRFQTVVLEKTVESPLDCKEIQPVHPKGDQSLVFIGGTDVEAETKILWPTHVKSRLIWKDPDAGKDWGQEEKGTTEDEMVGWHHRLNGHGFGWTLGVGDGQGGLACCGSWGWKELDTTEWLNWTELMITFPVQSFFNYVIAFLKLFFSFFWACVAIKRIKEKWVFLFFPDNKEDNRRQAWSLLVFTLFLICSL